MSPDARERLTQVASILEPHLRHELLRLVGADSRAARVVELEHRTHLAEDLAAERLRQLHAAHRREDRRVDSGCPCAITCRCQSRGGGHDA